MSLNGYVNRPSELRLISGTGEAMRALRDAGYLLCVVTNQSAIERGHWDDERLHLIHDRLDDLLKHAGAQPDLVLACPHVPWEGCNCRKPEPGMLGLGARLLRSTEGFEGMRQRWKTGDHAQPHVLDVMVGDRKTDLEAGARYGARSFWAKRDRGLQILLPRLLDTNDTGDGVA
jgi:D-glycero-D-manno-heptose 1,7-bisphosphate phosphatase